MISAKTKSELKKKSMALEPVVRIGKNGITQSSITEIKKQLKKKKLVKVKFLKTFIEGKNKKALAKSLAAKTDSELVHSVGFIAVLWKP